MRINKLKTYLGDEKKKQERVPVLVKESSYGYDNCGKLEDPYDVYRMLNDVFHHGLETEEVVYLLCFTTKHKLIGVFEASRGILATCFMNHRELYMKALLAGAAHIIVAHNHPSGDIMPSGTDLKTTEGLIEAGKLLGITLRDHLVISDASYYSMKANNVGGFEKQAEGKTALAAE